MYKRSYEICFQTPAFLGNASQSGQCLSSLALQPWRGIDWLRHPGAAA